MMALKVVITFNTVSHYALQPLQVGMEPEILCGDSWEIDPNADPNVLAPSPCIHCTRIMDEVFDPIRLGLR